jgi:hypothetical protein
MKKGLFGSIGGLVLTVLLVFNAVPAFAATSIYCDNDSNTYSTYSDKASNGYPAFVYHYDGASNHKYGDYEISSLITSDYRYHYDIPISSYPAAYNLEVYLNDGSFTNREAHYWYGISYIGKVNQYSALGGWNYVGVGNDWSTIYAQVSSEDFNPNHPNNTQTGADEIHIYN